MITIRWSRREKGLCEVGWAMGLPQLAHFCLVGFGTTPINTSCLLIFTCLSVGTTGLLATDRKLSSLLNVVPMGITNRL